MKTQGVSIFLFVFTLTFFVNQKVYTQADSGKTDTKKLGVAIRFNNLTDAVGSIISFPITYYWCNISVPEYTNRDLWLNKPFLQVAFAFGRNGNSFQGRMGYIVLGGNRVPEMYIYLFADINYVKLYHEKSYVFPTLGIGERTTDWPWFTLGMVNKQENLWLDIYGGYMITDNDFIDRNIKFGGHWTLGLGIEYTFTL